jgi:predicted Zn-dependent protease
VFGEMDARNKCAVVSVRRLREAFYRRKADPAKQRARLLKLVLQVVGRLQGLADCRDPRCVMAPTGALADVDLKAERLCAVCSRRLATGVIRI